MLRKELSTKARNRGLKLYYPRPILCTDNAAMVASAAYYEYGKENTSDLYLNAIPSLKLGER